MRISEAQLSLFQQCPQRLEYALKAGTTSLLGDLWGPIEQATTWLWAQEIRTGDKPSLKAAKHKWGQAVTSWGVTSGLKTVEIRDFITKHLGAFLDYWSWFHGSPFEPVTVAAVRKLHLGKHTLEVTPQVIVLDEKKIVVLNTSADNSNHDTVTNYVYRARLLSVAELVKEPVTMLNFRFNGRLELLAMHSNQLCTKQFKKNLSWQLRSIAAGVSMPIHNCRIQCPFKEICFV